MNKKSIKILLIIIALFMLAICSKKVEAKELAEGDLCFPVGNTTEDMTIEYQKKDRVYVNGSISSSLISAKYKNWIEKDNKGNHVTEHHYGIDITSADPSKVKSNEYDIISAAQGTVIATSAKRITYAGTSFADSYTRKHSSKCDGGGYGNYVIVRMDGLTIKNKQVYTLYGHMYADSLKVELGQKVAAGTILGKMGSSGDSGHPHLHFEVFTAGPEIENQLKGAKTNITTRSYVNPEIFIKSQDNIAISLVDATLKKQDDYTIMGELKYNGLVNVNEAPKFKVKIGKSDSSVQLDYQDNIQKGGETILIYKMPILESYAGEVILDNISDGDIAYKINESKKVTKNEVKSLSGEKIILEKGADPIEPYSVGDVNGDAKIDVMDAMVILKSLTSSVTLDNRQRLAADVDKNGEINAYDALSILMILVKLENN